LPAASPTGRVEDVEVQAPDSRPAFAPRPPAPPSIPTGPSSPPRKAAADRHRVASTATRLLRGYYEATSRLLRGYHEATMRLLPGYYQASTRLLTTRLLPARQATNRSRARATRPACTATAALLVCRHRSAQHEQHEQHQPQHQQHQPAAPAHTAGSSPPAQHQQQQQQQQQPSRVVDEWCETMLFWTSYLSIYLSILSAQRVRCITTPSHHQSPQTALRWADATSGSAETQRRDLPPHSSRCAMHHHLGALRPTRKTALPEKPCLRLTDSRLQLLSCCCALLLACTGAEGAPDRADA
jgi:hypothetical protein